MLAEVHHNCGPVSGPALTRVSKRLTDVLEEMFGLEFSADRIKPRLVPFDGRGLEICIEAPQLSAGHEPDPAGRIRRAICEEVPGVEVVAYVICADGPSAA